MAQTFRIKAKVTNQDGLIKWMQVLPKELSACQNTGKWNDGVMDRLALGKNGLVWVTVTIGKGNRAIITNIEEAEREDFIDLSTTIDPLWVGDVCIPGETVSILDAATKMAESFGNCNVFTTGPSGCGKTQYAQSWAAYNGWNFHYLYVPTLRPAEELMMHRELRNGETVDVPTAFTEAIGRGNLVLLLDELNRPPNNSYLNPLMSLLDHRNEIQAGGYTFQVQYPIMIVSTANIGWQYTGTLELDPALVNRFHLRHEVSYLPVDIEQKILYPYVNENDAYTIVAIMNLLRTKDVEFDVSTRTAITIAKLVGVGQSLAWSFLHVLPKNKTVIDVVMDSL